MITSTRIFITDCLDPYVNLATEDALLRSLPEKQAILFLWRNAHTVVIGAGQNAYAECRTSLLEREGGKLARRSTGGGAVYHDLGNLNFSFIVPKDDYDVARQLRVVIAAARDHGIVAESSGRNDITADGRKFSGNAFRILKTSALHHGTLLVHVDAEKMGRYLNVSPDKLKAKGVKSVPSRVVNLCELGDVTVDSMRLAMIGAFAREYGVAPVEDVRNAEIPGLDALIEKYRSWDWIYGRSPEGGLSVSTRFDWGGVELHARLSSGRLRDVRVFTDAMDETLHERLAEALEGCPWQSVALYEKAVPVQEDVAKWLQAAAE